MTRLIGDAPFTEVERAAVLMAARSMLGMPWRHQARSLGSADCIGFGWLAFNRVRQILRPRTDYGRTPSAGKLREEMILYFGPPLPIGTEPIPADVVTLDWGHEERHLAIVTDHPDYGIGLIHADNRAPGAEGPRVVEHGIDKYWRNRICEVWRP